MTFLMPAPAPSPAKEACEERRLPRKRQPPDAKGLKMEIWF
jgi:hypothetical protein